MRKANGAERNILSDLIAAGGTCRRDEIIKGELGHERVLTELETQGWISGEKALLVSITEAGRKAMLSEIRPEIEEKG